MKSNLIAGVSPKIYKATYYKNHKETMKRQNAANRVKNHDRIRRQSAKYIRTDQGRYRALLHNAKQYKRKVHLTFEAYVKLIDSPCFYCGGRLPATGSGLDRIKSKQDYTSKNVRPCCTICNQAKNTLSSRQFKKWIIKVYHHWISRMAL